MSFNKKSISSLKPQRNNSQILKTSSMSQFVAKGGVFIFEKNSVFLVELILIMGYSLYHLFIFFDTFMVYAALHAIRQGWAYSKSDISSTFGVSKEYLGIVDALYLVSYSAGMAVLGSFMHRFTLKIYVIMGLTVASICYMSWMVIYSVTGFYSVVLMTILMCINGFFQATGWPGIMGIFSQWFAGHRKGVLMGIWSCSANAGDIIASVFLNMFSDHNVDFVWNFILTGGLGLLVALSLFLFLKQKPEQSEVEANEDETQKSLIENPKYTSIDANQTTQPALEEIQSQQEPPKTQFKYGIFSALCIPKVPMYVFSYACIKGCIYGLFFWLPTILDEKGGDIADQKGYITAMFDVGAVAGALFVGFLADHFKKRALFLSPILFLCAIVIFLLSFAMNQIVWPYYIVIFFVGFTISGPYNIIGTLIAIEIGNSIKEKGGVAKVSSLNEGFAALLTSASMIVIPHLDESFVFYLFTAECLVATLLLVPPLLQEIKEIRSKNTQKDSETQ